MNRLSLCLHDVRVSKGVETIEIIETVVKKFRIPVTIHLIADEDIRNQNELLQYLLQKISEKSIEVVFHGIHHLCSTPPGGLLTWYHKNQAEYLCSSYQLLRDTQAQYQLMSELLGQKPGICPPCWLASKSNWEFLQTLNPPYIEHMSYTSSPSKKNFSPVLSIGTNVRWELFMIKIFITTLIWLSILLKYKNIRMVIHTIDIQNSDSMKFFEKIYSRYFRKSKRVLLKDFCN